MKRAFTSTAAGVVLLFVACSDHTKQSANSMTGGNVERGKAAIEHYGCAGCHVIPGIRYTAGLVGPPLKEIAIRSYIGGVAENTPENMERWIENPQALSPKTAMPNLHVTESDARDIAAYLYTLR